MKNVAIVGLGHMVQQLQQYYLEIKNYLWNRQQ